MLKFEFAAEVGGLFEAQIVRHFLNRFAGKKHCARRVQPALIQPALRRNAETTAEFALQLPGG